MKRWMAAVVLVIGLVYAVSSVRAATAGHATFELYSWKDGNEWMYSLLPASKERRIDIEIIQAGIRGAGKMKEKLLGMKEGDSIAWLQRPERKMVYPPDAVMQEIREYAQTVGVKMFIKKPPTAGHAASVAS